MSRPTLDEWEINRIIKLTEYGLTARQIAERLGISATTVRKYTNDIRDVKRREDCIHYLESPTGERFVVDKDLMKFAKERGLCYTAFSRIGTKEAIEKGFQHKGWRAYKPFEYCRYRNRTTPIHSLSPEEIEEIEKAAETEASCERIARKLNRDIKTVRKYVKMWRARNNVTS